MKAGKRDHLKDVMNSSSIGHEREGDPETSLFAAALS